MVAERILKACGTEFEGLKGRFGRDDDRIFAMLVELCQDGLHHPDVEVLELSTEAEILQDKWRGDSRGSGLERSFSRIWEFGKSLAGQKTARRM